MIELIRDSSMVERTAVEILYINFEESRAVLHVN